MKFTLSWLKEHLETNATFENIVEKLELLGFPCEYKQKTPSAWNEIEIVQIIGKEKHPNADKLNLYEIKKADGSILKIVCGDSSLEISDCIPYAKPGVVIPLHEKPIKTATIRGVESAGMLCSGSELMLPIISSGVLKCSREDFGKSIAQSWEHDGIIEIEVTPNRADMLSIRGIARTLSFHALGKLIPLELIDFSNLDLSKQHKNYINSSIQSEDCSALGLTYIEYSPKPTKSLYVNRLLLCGFSPTNIDVVDLTNYTMHEIGHPMHAFDSKKINGTLIIKNLEKEEKFKTLSGKEIELQVGTLVISDDKKILSWPGVIGGDSSKIDSNSTSFLLEAGMFKIDSIQRRQHAINTNAAKLFERNVDPLAFKITLSRYCFLLDVKPIWYEFFAKDFSKEIDFDLSYIEKILGIKISQEELRNKLEPRGFKFNGSKISIPSYKYYDIQTQNCIVEEFAAGEYDKIKSINLPPRTAKIYELNSVQKLAQEALNLGFFETLNFSTTLLEHPRFELKEHNRKIINALSANYSMLRGTQIPQLLRILAWHKRNAYNYECFFESGPVYLEKQEECFTAIALEFESLLSIFYNFLNREELEFPKTSYISVPWLSDGISFFEKDSLIATCGEICSDILKEFDLKKVFAIQIWPERFSLKKKSYHVFTDQMPIYKDISFKLPAFFKTGDLTDFLKDLGYIFEVFDIYPSKSLECERNFGLRFMFQEKSTLLSEEILARIEKIKTQIEKRFGIISI